MLLLALVLSAAGGDKTTICHRTNSAKNPYVQITVSNSSIDGDTGDKGDHYSEHRGPVPANEAEAQAYKDAKTEWGDIIPPTKAQPSGLNWNSKGRGVYDNGCTYTGAPPPSTPTPTPDPSPTVTAPPTATPTSTVTPPKPPTTPPPNITKTRPPTTYAGPLARTGVSLWWLVLAAVILLLFGFRIRR